jgi:hypothetical protein
MYPPVHCHRVLFGSLRAREDARRSGVNLEMSKLASSGRVVREDVSNYASYEAEGSERRSIGTINVTADARWLATLTVPISDSRVAFVHVERHGALPAGYRGNEESAHFSLPIDETDALVALLAGIVDQARRDGVLP